MDQGESTATDARFTVKTTSDSHFSWIRTRLSVERTLLSWIRTAVSLVGFGFTIVQFFDRLPQLGAIAPARFPEAPRFVGLALIACGVAALAISAWEYRWALRYLWSGEFRAIAGAAEAPVWTPIYFVTLALLIVGAGILLSLLFRIF